MKFLTEIGHPLNGQTIKLTKITQANKQINVFIKNYPTYLTLDYIKDLPSVMWAERNVRRGTKTDRSQVIAIWEGEVPTQIYLLGFRPCKVEKYVGKPAFCGNCQKWGHRVWECDGITKCGFCSERHDTSICKEKLEKKEQITYKCPNCSGTYNAVSNVPRDRRPHYTRERR